MDQKRLHWVARFLYRQQQARRQVRINQKYHLIATKLTYRGSVKNDCLKDEPDMVPVYSDLLLMEAFLALVFIKFCWI